MSLVRVCTRLLVVVLLTATAHAQEPRLEILKRHGDFYWVVETAPDGSRKGGWVSAAIPIDRIDRSALQPIPPSGSVQVAPPAVVVSDMEPPVSRPLAATQMPAPIERYSPPSQRTPTPQPIQQGANAHHPQAREGFWFSAGMGVGWQGCDTCIGREAGGTGDISLGGAISEKSLLGVGSSAWVTSIDGVTLTAGTFDLRTRWYPSLTSGFFLTGGIGLGSLSAWDIFGNAYSETGFGGVFGLGVDVRVSRNVSLTPYYNGFWARTSNLNGNVNQFGIGITIH